LAAPYAPPPVPRRRRRGGSVVGPLLLIFLGVVFLLQNTGYLPPNFWVNLWRLWPLVLVLVGIELLLSQRVPWLALAGLAVVALVLGSLAINTSLPALGRGPAGTATTTTTAQTNLDGANQAAVSVRFGAGQLNVGSIDNAQANALATMSYSGPARLAPEPRYVLSSGGVGQLDYVSSGRPGPGGFFPLGGSDGSDGSRMDLNLAPGVPITALNVQTGAAEAHLDLSQLRVSTLDMSVGAASAWVRFPAAAGLTTAHISGGASTLTLEIPDGVAAQIQHQGGLSTLNVDQSRFPQVSDSLFRSPDYDTAANKVDLSIETGVTSIQIS
jgi:hypothetical protein